MKYERPVGLTDKQINEAYNYVQYDTFKRDVVMWAEDNDCNIDEELAEDIAENLMDDFDCTIDYWDNIERAYNLYKV